MPYDVLHASIISWTDVPGEDRFETTMEQDGSSFSRSGVTVSWDTKDLGDDVREVTLSVTQEGTAERGILLRFDLPLPETTRLTVWESVNERSERVPASLQEIQPFAVVTGRTSGSGAGPEDDTGYGLAVSPATPVAFRTGVRTNGSKQGFLSIELPIGLLPAGAASEVYRVSFIVCEVSPEWGLRDLLRAYYDVYRPYFTREAKRNGAWLFVGNFTTADYVSADTIHNPADFAFHEIGVMHEYRGDSNANAAQSAERGILPFRYFIPGQREAGFLDHIPETSEEALSMLDRTGMENYQLPFGLDLAGIREEISTSSVRTANGRPIIVPRWTHWSQNTLTLPLNMDPALGDGSRGSNLLDAAEQFLAEHPYYAGIYLDSLGWLLGYTDYHPAHCRLRPESLTCDEDGRVGVDLRVAAYHFQKELSQKLHAQDRYVFANGISVRRPFNATQTDIMGTEGGSDLAKAAILRSYAFQKPIVHLSYRYYDLPYIENYLKSCVVFGNVPAMGGRYYQDDNGYTRDQDIHRRYLPVVRTLSAAGWQPVTYAKTETDVLIERFGKAAADGYHPSDEESDAVGPHEDIYFSLHEPDDSATDFIPSTRTRTIHVEFDTANLFGPERGDVYVYHGFTGERLAVLESSSGADDRSVDLLIRPGTPSVLRLRRQPLPVECAIVSPADVIMNGRSFSCEARLRNTTGLRTGGTLEVRLPAGWSADWETRTFELDGGEQLAIQLEVKPVHVFWFREYSIVLECSIGAERTTVSLALPLLHQKRFALRDESSADQEIESATGGFLS